MIRKVWRDGALIAWDAATISALAHPMQRGSLVFDVMSFHDTAAGVGVFRLREHVARFLRSCAIVGLSPRFAAEELIDACRATVADTGLREGLLRISGFFPTLEADLVPCESTASVLVAAYARDELRKHHKPAPCLRVQIPRDVRKAAPDAIPPLAKVAAAYLGPMIARRRALDEGFDEVVLLDHLGNIAEAPTANVMAVIGGTLVTPPLGCILDGITRDAVLTLAREEGVPVVERAITPDELTSADEAFLTATSYLIAPIASFDGVALAVEAPGPITARLRARFSRVITGEDARAANWFTMVR